MRAGVQLGNLTLLPGKGARKKGCIWYILGSIRFSSLPTKKAYILFYLFWFIYFIYFLFSFYFVLRNQQKIFLHGQLVYSYLLHEVYYVNSFF